MQTAEANILNLNQKNTTKSFIVFDSGAQRTYITKGLKQKLNLTPFKEEEIAIKVFGSTESKVQNIDVVKLIVIGARKNVYVEALVIPTICSNLYTQCSNKTISNIYSHLKNLKRAQKSNETCVKVDILIGLDYYYYNLMTGNIIKGKPNEPIALESTLGWIISGPYSSINSTNVYNINSHFLFAAPSNSRYNVFENETDHKLSTIWDIESEGVDTKELEIYQNFENDLEFTGERYYVKLPFKPMTELVPDNFITSKKRLSSLKHKLDCNQKLKEQCDNILKDYEKEGIIEKVNEVCEPGASHYLPHQAVIKENRDTSKVRIVFDGSSKQKDQPAFNELLHSEPCLLPLLYDILLRFRLGTIAITADIKQAFLQILVDKKYQTFLRFLWYNDVFSDDPNSILYRFTRVIFEF